MKLLFTTALILFSLSSSFAQIVPVRQVVASGGKDTLVGRIVWASTVGEAVVTTITAGNTTLTQGFHQPDGYYITPFFPYLNNLVIYPNPGKPNAQLRFYLKADKPSLIIKIFDATGKLYSEQVLESYAGQTWHSLNPQIMSSGSYTVRVYAGDEIYTGKYIVVN